MKILVCLIMLFILSSCSTDKGTFWCGDHPCINNAEKEAYFKKTMVVEFRETKKNNEKERTELNKILEQAKINEKNRISDEKALKKQTILNNKKKNKEKKAILKKEKLYEKTDGKKKKLKTKNKSEDSSKNNKVKVTKNEPVNINEFSIDKFEDVVKRINDKNLSKPFPDINDTPN